MKLEEIALKECAGEKSKSDDCPAISLTACRTAVLVYRPQKQPGYIDLLEKNLGRYMGKDDNLSITVTS